MRVSGGGLRALVALAAVALLSAAWPAAAGAGIVSVEPTTGQVQPGGRLRVTVWVESSTFLCLTAAVEPAEPSIAVGFDVPCATGRWRARLTVQTSRSTPLGTYTVRIGDGGSTHDVVLEVGEAPGATTTTAPPAEPTTTVGDPTTVPTTVPTTAPPTTGAPVTTAVPAGPTTTARGTATTAPPAAPPTTGGSGTSTTAPGAGGGGQAGGGGDAGPAGSGAGGSGGTGSGSGGSGAGESGGTGSGSGGSGGGPPAGSGAAGGPTAVAGVSVVRGPGTDRRPVAGRPDGGATVGDELAASTAPPAPMAEAAFRPVAGLATVAPPAEGLFLPLRARPAAGSCLPLTGACRLGDDGLVVVPPASVEIRWREPPAGAGRLPPLGGRGVPVLEPVGEAPDGAATMNFLLPVLDLGAGNGQVKGLPRGLDASGSFAPPATGRRAVPPVAEGARLPTGASPLLASAPFDRPYRLAAAQLVEAFPAVVVFAGPRPTPLYGLRTDPSWDLEVSFVPLLGAGSPSFLGRPEDGPPGLFVALPAGLEAPGDERPAGGGAEAGGQGAPGSDGGAVSGLRASLLVPLGALLVGGAVVAWRRRQSASRL